MGFIKMFMLHAAGSIYETVSGQNHTQRLIRRKAGNVVRLLKGEQPLRSWQDGRRDTPSRAESERLNREAARSI
jgi:hypothetical protein